MLVSQRDFEAALAEVGSGSLSCGCLADFCIQQLVPSVSQTEMQHYKQVQSKFSSSTMNSEATLAKKQLEADQKAQRQIEAPKPNGTALPNGLTLPNGVYVNGHASSEEEDDAPVVKKDKGKEKAREH